MSDEITFLYRQWANGGSAIPVIRRLLAEEKTLEAACCARMAIITAPEPEREELEAAIFKAGNVSEEWIEAMKEFAKAPSLERWDELLEFVPDDDIYQRMRASISLLVKFGCDFNMIFRCATKYGIPPDVHDLVATGKVDPEVIVERGAESPVRSMWLAMAARAAFARGDRWTTLKYLRDACKDEEQIILSMVSIDEIRDLADEDFNAELDKIGVPSGFSRR